MDEDEDWMFRPILAGLLPFTAIKDTAYDLADFVTANEVLDVQAENHYRQHRAQKALADQQRRKVK